MSIAEPDTRPATPYEAMGGKPVVRTIVNRFYDLMEGEPAYAALRALHAPDLGPMRDSLTDFLTAWLGGPRDWFDARPGACVMSAHKKVNVTPATAREWTDAMARALVDSGVAPEIAAQVNAAFARMAMGMSIR